ncbi:hypothetical protein [Burkholderia cenocepacia]|uniref:hypothetical protein n=1 Tax=Burkholderia cenocepacia TaxID=95486 RepID=UPI00076D2B65|nr:hypothetical protein [Burkholderia cenocepacia]KWU26286.1 hypothetical protein AS149_25175 [Burkholderia cenocepacia]
MQISNPDVSTMRPCGFTTHDGLPAIQWWRAGDVSKGEKRVVVAMTTYADETSRHAAHQATRSSCATTQKPAATTQVSCPVR